MTTEAEIMMFVTLDDSYDLGSDEEGLTRGARMTYKLSVSTENMASDTRRTIAQTQI